MGENGSIQTEKLIALNKERIDILSSREYFSGKKLLKYVTLLRHHQLLQIPRELVHDAHAFFFKSNASHRMIRLEDDGETTFNKKIVVYTCIYGNYDNILEPLSIDPLCEYHIFTDQDLPSDSVWKLADDSRIPVDCTTPALKNRYVKMFPYKFFDSEYSIYIDGNLQIVGNPSALIQRGLKRCRTGIAMHIAPRECCIYDEARSAYHLKKISKEELGSVLKLYKSNGMPQHFGMFECNVISRWHQNTEMKTIMESWWNWFKYGVKRDQLYFTFVLNMLGYSFEDVINYGASVNLNPLFIRRSHS